MDHSFTKMVPYEERAFKCLNVDCSLYLDWQIYPFALPQDNACSECLQQLVREKDLKKDE